LNSVSDATAHAVQQVVDELHSAGVELAEAQIEALQTYLHEVRHAGTRFNLVSARDLDRLGRRHLLESFNVLRHPITLAGKRLADVGSGAGFPAIPLAIWQPDLEVLLIESVRKKAQFLARIIEKLRLEDRVESVCARAEDVATEPARIGQYDVVTARGTGKLSRVVAWSAPLIRPSGYLVAFKGRQAEEEILEATAVMEAQGVSLGDVVPLRWGEGSLVILRRRIDVS
jgi:16S rRNA (guanine527-N7)-methyltransferase